jgi:ABC-type uncharacterized transport system ATPase component
MPERLERYRRNVEKCLAVATTFKDPEARRTMLVTADEWLMLAAQRAKIIGTAKEQSTPPNALPSGRPS